MASVFVVDAELKDSVLEFGAIVDGVNETNDFSQSLQAHFVNESSEISDKDELVKTIYSGVSNEGLSKLSDKEFESAFNLVLYLVLQLDGSKGISNGVLIQTLVDINPVKQASLRDRRSIKSTTILSCFNTIFNVLPANSATRITILEKIFYIANVSQGSIPFKLLSEGLGSNLISWLTSAGASETQIKSLFYQFVALDQQYSLETLGLIKNFTQIYTVSETEAEQIALFALKSETMDVSSLFNNNLTSTLKNSSSSELCQLFLSYAKGQVIKHVPELLELYAEHIKSKSRVLNLVKFFADNEASKSKFTYSEIPDVVDHLDFEILLINAIKAGVIEGKLNQVEQTFYLTKVNRFIIAKEDNTQNWEAVKKTLYNWKNALININQVVNEARENIVQQN
ncbi:uncharacterized protein KQ657_002026 [Scheffersomyces spartinae]|uniref:Eukaryotic translation initiation factor 3 subunit M n=1 Tax=Scheffersomyces spartinae TaxID=45513 RepID=A0A9P7V6V0_9ASCO|nr:uncharacterized protein KQ657_002026 [Scheffersomyces spartinae]KAG7192307.1 hypothetical protein KQ657_002026 [Scheffersomyces spartinae]